MDRSQHSSGNSSEAVPSAEIVTSADNTINPFVLNRLSNRLMDKRIDLPVLLTLILMGYEQKVDMDEEEVHLLNESLSSKTCTKENSINLTTTICSQSPRILATAEQYLAQYCTFPCWARDQVLLQTDLLPILFNSFTKKDHAVSGVYKLWKDEWSNKVKTIRWLR